MSRRRRKPLPQEPVRCHIETLGHDGRGIARENGKIQFVDGALPGETVRAKVVGSRSKFDELRTLEVLEPSAQRLTPPCDFADLCGGCSLQHMSGDAQIRFKEQTLREHFAHFGGIEPEEWVAPMRAETLGYRRKARLARAGRAAKPGNSVPTPWKQVRGSVFASLGR